GQDLLFDELLAYEPRDLWSLDPGHLERVHVREIHRAVGRDLVVLRQVLLAHDLEHEHVARPQHTALRRRRQVDALRTGIAATRGHGDDGDHTGAEPEPGTEVTSTAVLGRFCYMNQRRPRYACHLTKSRSSTCVMGVFG